MADEGARSRLGRGLAALIGDVKTDAAAAPGIDRGPRPPRRLPVGFLRPNPRNPRKSFQDSDLADLAASIKEKGVVQPLIVRQVGADQYEIIAGERRWRAAQKAGLHEVPVVIREASDKESLELAIIENVQRADLNAIEEAKGYQQLIADHAYSQEQVAQIIGKSRSHIANTLRLLTLPEGVQVFVLDGRLSAGQARALITMPDPTAVALRILNEGMTTRDIEAMGGESRRGKSGRKAKHKDADTRAMEKGLSDALGLEVTIAHRGGKGDVRIKYTSLEQLDDIARRLRG
ncbi:MAG TPA: ParB/RepB/Spo0J family partition protein [Bauldia sp.]|nr:ParB/RepB/Spo0J family partition protein [Bauldia sp.]